MNTTYEGKDMKGTVLRLEKSSIHDGFGLRTVVFLKGCLLRCQWCSTPESQNFNIETAETNTYGEVMTVEQVLKEIRKDIPFYFHSGGGLTISGGELLAQPEFARNILRQARKEGINRAIETTFYAKWETVESILQYTNTAFVDLKFFTSDLHKEYCGVDNEIILENLLNTNKMDKTFELIIRIPLIPGVNDSREELCKMGEFCAKLKNMDQLQLLPYHALGSDTYRKLGRPYKLKNVNSPSEEHMEECRAIMKQYVENVI